MKKLKRFLKDFDPEKREYQRVKKAIKEKKSDWLSAWLEKYSKKGDFWYKPQKDDWL